MSDRPVVAVAWLPLSRAMICCSCETVLDISYRVCPPCGSEVIWPLEKWLNAVKAKPPMTTEDSMNEAIRQLGLPLRIWRP